MTTSAQLAEQLDMFTGTENWYRHSLNRKVLYTDGVKHFAMSAGAYWFLDILATEGYELHGIHSEYFLSITMTVANRTAIIVITDGNEKQIFSKDIPFTDCPNGIWKFFMIDDVQHSTILLTSEY